VLLAAQAGWVGLAPGNTLFCGNYKVVAIDTCHATEQTTCHAGGQYAYTLTCAGFTVTLFTMTPNKT